MTEQQQDSQVVIRGGKELVHDSLGALPGLSSRAMFWRPKYLCPSDWLDHVPFAFWLIDSTRPKVLVELGADRGGSYFAFCQAADKLNTDTRCFAIDQWSLRQQDAELQQLQQYSQSQYEEFSRIIDHDYFQAPALFVDGSIDVLHLNLPDTGLDLVLLFQLWEPKLSANAVVLLHHSQQNTAPAVTALKNKLISQRRHFEFLQAQGLLVVQWQRQPSELFGRLMEIRPGDKTYEMVQNLFSRLGKACSESINATEARQQALHAQHLLQDTRRELADTQQRFAGLLTELQEHKSWLASRNEELGQLNQQLNQSEQQRLAEQEILTQRIQLLETLRTELKQELEHLFAHVEQLNADQQQQQNAEKELRQQLLQAQTQAAQTVAELRQQLAAAQTQAELDLARQQQQAIEQLAAAQAEAQQALHQQQAADAQAEAAQQQLQSLQQSLQNTQADKQELERQLQVLTEDLANRAQEQAALVRQTEQERSKLAEGSARQHEQTEQALVTLRQELQELKTQQQQLQQQKSALEQQKTAQEQQIAELITQKTALEQATQIRFQELAALTGLYQESQRQAEALSQEQQALVSRLQQLQDIKAQLEDKTSQLEAANAQLELQRQQDQQQLQQQMLEQRQQQDQLREGLQQRDAELERCHNELVQLSQLLSWQQGQAAASQAKLQAELNMLKRQLQQMRHTFSWKITAPWRALAALFGGKKDPEAQLRKDEQLIEQTGLFDENWYLNQYPDVAGTGIPALRHYLKFGGFEGRLPNPDFDSAFYLAQYPDVVSAGLNPLVHFVRFGRQEQRLTCPQLVEEGR